MVDTPTRSRGGALHIPRSRGAASGLLVIVLGLWGALVPFIGPYFNFAFSPDQAWTWTAGRGWLEVLPGAVAVAADGSTGASPDGHRPLPLRSCAALKHGEGGIAIARLIEPSRRPTAQWPRRVARRTRSMVDGRRRE